MLFYKKMARLGNLASETVARHGNLALQCFWTDYSRSRTYTLASLCELVNMCLTEAQANGFLCYKRAQANGFLCYKCKLIFGSHYKLRLSEDEFPIFTVNSNRVAVVEGAFEYLDG